MYHTPTFQFISACAFCVCFAFALFNEDNNIVLPFTIQPIMIHFVNLYANIC